MACGINHPIRGGQVRSCECGACLLCRGESNKMQPILNGPAQTGTAEEQRNALRTVWDQQAQCARGHMRVLRGCRVRNAPDGNDDGGLLGRLEVWKG